MIKVNNIGKKYKERYVFKNLSFSINSGEMVAIIGKSGCGKTTLLNCIGQLESLTHGSIAIDGIILTKKNRKYFFRNTVGFLFQNFALIDNETVKENLQIVSKNQAEMISLLKKFDMENLLNTKVYKLSGGEQQRVALVRVMLKDPNIILADEPTASMDRDNAKIVIQSLKELNSQGKTVIVVTHDQGLLSNFHRVIDLNPESENSEASEYTGTY